MPYTIEEVPYDQIHKPTFLTMVSIYSLCDALIFHPFVVTSAVAELHRVKLPVDSGMSFLAKLKSSFKANLSIRGAAGYIIRAGGGDAAKASASTVLRAMYTGFPATFCGLFLYDIVQMLPYSYMKTRLDESDSLSESIPKPMLAAVLPSLICVPFSNAFWVLLRQQVQQRCTGQPHSLSYLFNTRLPSMEGGTASVLLRGTMVSLFSSVPLAAVNWQIYETTKKRIQATFDTKSVWTSVASGCVSGGLATLLTRPIGVVVARMQTDAERSGFMATAKAVYRAEGPGAFYKGLLARLLSSVPRSGLFFAVYQSIVTWSKLPQHT